METLKAIMTLGVLFFRILLVARQFLKNAEVAVMVRPTRKDSSPPSPQSVAVAKVRRLALFYQQQTNYWPWQPERGEWYVAHDHDHKDIYTHSSGNPGHSQPLTPRGMTTGGGRGMLRYQRRLNHWPAGSIAHSGVRGTSWHILETVTGQHDPYTLFSTYI